MTPGMIGLAIGIAIGVFLGFSVGGVIVADILEGGIEEDETQKHRGAAIRRPRI